MRADFHMHTSFSVDSDTNPEDMVRGAIQKGLKTICITEHIDRDNPEVPEIDYPCYIATMEMIREKYKNQIEVLTGMEFGMQPHLGEMCQRLASTYSFDFIIGSAHIIDGQDPYDRTYFVGKTDEDAYRRGFEFILEDMINTPEFDSLGHLDYVVRYGHNRERDYSYAKYADELDAILKYLVENGKGLEVNTGGWKYGLPFAHPHPDILKRYKELGGEIITVGSDAHKPEHIAYDFHRLGEYLKANGFAYYTEFRQRKPYFCAI